MRMNILTFWALLAAVGSAAPAAAHGSKPLKSAAVSLPSAVRDAATVVDAFHAALQRDDTTAAAVLLADDALIYESGGVERSKAEYASHHLPADAAFAKATERTVTRRSGHLSGNFAWVATESTTKGSYKERAINSVSTETMILRRDGTSWRIAHVHWSSANVK